MECIHETTVVGIDWLKWLPVILSAMTLAFNMIFYIYFKDYLAFKYTRINDLAKVSAEFLAFLSEIVSSDDFEGVPTKIKDYSEQILLCFKSEEVEISKNLEELFHAAQQRKNLKDEDEIKKWRERFRLKTSELQKHLRKHCGVIK